MRFPHWTSAILLSTVVAAAAPGASAKNYLLIIADDLGRDKIRAYEADFPGYAAAAQYLPQTNTIDSLASQGLRFTRAWANPVCSPTRASLQAGLHPYRDGMIIAPLGANAAGLDPTSFSTPVMAESFSSRGYATGYFGKWHIGSADANGVRGTPPAGTFTVEPHPSLLGWDRFYGTLEGEIHNYKDWTRVGWLSRGMGFVANETEHATTRTAEVALSWINSRSPGTPWLAIVAFHAPHSRDTSNTWDETDVDLTKIRSASLSCLDPDLDPATPPTCGNVSLAAYQALVEHMDIEIEGILLGMDDAVLDDTVIIFAGDNGTPALAAEWTFFDRDRGKGTAYETGVGVPLIIADGATWRTGAAGAISAPNRRVLAAVTLTDLYQTLHNHAFALSVAGDVAEDSISFVPCFTEDDDFCNFSGSRFGYAEWNGWAAVHFGYEKMVAERTGNCLTPSFFRTDDEPLELVAGKVDELRLQDHFTDMHDTVPTSWANGLGFCP